MKKAIVSAVVLLFVLAVSACTGPAGPAGPDGAAGKDANNLFAPPSNAVILVNENFEAFAVGVTPTGWTRATTWTGPSVHHPVTSTTFVSYDKSLMVHAVSGGGLYTDRQIVKCPGIEDAIPNTLSGKVYIEFYANKSTADKAKGFVFYINQLEKLRIDFGLDGKINAFTDINSSVPVGAYRAGEWVKVNIVLNLTQQKYALYTDGVLRVKDIPCYNTQEQLNDSSTIGIISRVYKDFFGVLTNQTADYIGDHVYLDDVLIYYVP